LKIVKGRGDSGKFFPADTVNKAEALKMLLLVNRQKISDTDEKPYNDVEISDWFSGYFMQAQEKKLFDQSSSQNVYPAQTLTRGDLVEMMYRYQQQKLKREFSGIIDPAGTEHPEVLPAIEKDAWDGITLDREIIPVFRKGEITEISGKISPANSSDNVSIIVTDFEGKSFTFIGDSRDGKFSIPVFFKETGDIQIGILKGKSGSYITYSGKVFSGIADASSSEISPTPENFVAKHSLGKLLLMWDKKGNDVFHIQFRQNERVKNIYVNRKNSVLVPTSVFEGFKRGEIQVFIRGAKSSDTSSLNLITKFSSPQKIKISVFERFTETVSDDIEILSANYEYDNTISLKGRIKKSEISGNSGVILGKGYVLNTQEELFEKTLGISGNASQNFSLTFSPKRKDFYVIEISEKGGRALAVLPFAPRGMFPVLPNEFDRKSETLTKISQSDVFARINSFRKKHGRKALQLDSVISELALIRAEDMKKRNYFSHTTPAGKTVNDFRIDLGVKVPLSENIAIHSESGLDATYSLEFSPTHRQNLLDENISRVGIGLEEKENGSIILVQLFAGEKITESVLSHLQSEISGKILKKNTNITESSVLKKMTQQWANIMADQKDVEVKFSYDSGENWDDLIKNYKIQRTLKVYIGSFPSQESLRNFINNESEQYSGVFSSPKKTFGISLSMSDEGMIFLCMVGEE